MKIVITGGAGFIGSQIVDRFATLHPQASITVLDKMTYAADIRNIMHHISNGRIELIVGDICERDCCDKAVQGADLVIHTAAESHVDKSFGNSLEFSRTNVLGTHSLMESCLRAGVSKVIHVSTDEVYGEVTKGAADEDEILRPTNPYSASKAAAEMIINGYRRSFGLPVVIVRANNIFGVRQYPEKIIPKFILLLATGRKLTIHGSGWNSRHFLSVSDFSDALGLVAEKGEVGGVYNVGSEEEYSNLQVAGMICRIFGLEPQEHLVFVDDRLFNDARYAINWKRIARLGWKPQRRLSDELPQIAAWYHENFERFIGNGFPLVRKPLAA